jgi:hypothetical protein
MSQATRPYRKWLLRLSHQAAPFILLPYFMALLIAGTIAQRSMGPFEAQQMFFATPIIFLGGWLPIPGGGLVLVAATLSLSIKFLLFSQWSWRKAGINLAHLGVIILLAGGIAAYLFAHDGEISLAEGQQGAFYSDPKQSELVITQDNAERRIAFEDLKTGEIAPGIEIVKTCARCAIVAPTSLSGDEQGMAKGADLIEDPKPASNVPPMRGAMVKTESGIYLLLDVIGKPVEIEGGSIVVRHVRYDLPFAIALDDFAQGQYPGTDMAQSFQSKIRVIDGAVEWPATISMNAPLRYKGYTFYQSAFTEGVAEVSTLAVVKNPSWVFPYLGTLVLALGLLIHAIIAIRERKS